QVDDLPDGLGGEDEPSVTVVVPARNEAARIETTVQRLLSQRGVALSIVAVNDRSEDETGAILDRIAAGDERVRVVHVERLPEGWLGKCHALHAGTEDVESEWTLFLDADVWMREDVVARAVAAAERRGAQHLTVIPEFTAKGLFGKATMLFITLTLVRHGAWVNRDRRTTYLGVGAFNLVRTEAHRSIGRHERLRMEVIDDLKLALILKEAGYRARVYFATRDVEVEYAPTPRHLITVLEKNGFSLFMYSMALTCAALMGLLVMWGAPMIGLGAFGWAGWAPGLAAAAGMALAVAPCWMQSRKMGWSVWPAMVAPLSAIVPIVAVANSMVRTLSQGGIRWRGAFYPLAALREGRVRRRPRRERSGGTVL
ncbi:MAG: glycosyltransferase, partial [Planctomycetota bacterium]|nr:glycosyltransferase [Planctomycetota bacterium]